MNAKVAAASTVLALSVAVATPARACWEHDRPARVAMSAQAVDSGIAACQRRVPKDAQYHNHEIMGTRLYVEFDLGERRYYCNTSPTGRVLEVGHYGD